MYDWESLIPRASSFTLMSGTDRYCLRSAMICPSHSFMSFRAGRPAPTGVKKNCSALPSLRASLKSRASE